MAEKIEVQRDSEGRFLTRGYAGPLAAGAIRKALREALQRYGSTKDASGIEENAVWIALTERAMRGDPAALKLYLEYTAGKPVQELEVTAKQGVAEMSDEDLLRVAEQAAKALK